MGWCSATDIMDTALDGAEAAVKAALAAHSDLSADSLGEVYRPQVDDALRPFVTILAERLRAEDWDCVDESRYFERFPQEMLGHSDSEHHAWLLEKVKDTDGDPKWLDALKAHSARSGVQTRGH